MIFKFLFLINRFGLAIQERVKYKLIFLYFYVYKIERPNFAKIINNFENIKILFNTTFNILLCINRFGLVI